MKKYVLILVLIVLASQNTFSQEKKYDFNFDSQIRTALFRRHFAILH